MTTPTLTARIDTYLRAHGFTPIAHASRKYRAYKGVSGTGATRWYFVGKAGAVYSGATERVTHAISVSDTFKRELARWERTNA